MAAEVETKTVSAAAEQTGTLSLLDQAIGVTKTAEPDEMQDLLRTLTAEALSGTVTFSKNLTRPSTRQSRRSTKDVEAAGHHAPRTPKLEGSWRGLNYR
jgi:type VI secretion system protein ImpC